MKNLILSLVLLAAINCNAQRFELEPGAITVYADTITVEQAFQLTDHLLSGKMKLLDRYVIKDSVTYYSAGVHPFKRRTIYIMNKGVFVGKFNNKKNTNQL